MLAILALPALAGESANYLSFVVGLNEPDKASLQIGRDRLIEFDPYFEVPATIFRNGIEPFVALSFQLSELNLVSHVTVIGTNLDRTRDAPFLVSCVEALKRARFKKGETEQQQTAIVVLRFYQPK